MKRDEARSTIVPGKPQASAPLRSHKDSSVSSARAFTARFKQAIKRLIQSNSARLWFLLSIITTLPVTLSYHLWLEVWRGGRPRAWDGTGHYAIAQIYEQTIFPNTFGWTHAYFGGMPFPNFYPPVFYWCVALLDHTRLLSFTAAFKLVVALPVLLLPAALWLLGWTLSNRSRLAATGTALASIALMVDSRFLPFFPSGLDYFSTFQIGLYTQPLGFVLLVLWIAVYTNAHTRRWKFALACILLALTVLTNFFNAITATLVIAASLLTDWLRYRRAASPEQKAEAQRALIAHLSAPLVAVCLAAFWLVPMLSQYEYFVTRPTVIEMSKLVSPALAGWYALAVTGSVVWMRRPTRATWPYLATCLALAIGVLFAATIAPRWFPLQSSRFLSTLNFLLAVPVGQGLAAAFRAFAKRLGEISTLDQRLTLRQTRYTTASALVVLIMLALTSPGPRQALAFYSGDGQTDVNGVLAFARAHHDGRYLVEMINPSSTEASFDARAINSYLGAQGNETLSAVFHEASPNALVSLPVVNAFSQYPDSFGVSSLLADDLDFATQPLAQHLEQARQLGCRYLVIRSEAMKSRLAQESTIGSRTDFGSWSVFEVKGEAPPRVRGLRFRPALVVSRFTLKQRRSNELSFTRLVEEQFAEGWFDVLLARSEETRIDRLADLDSFGALILDTYNCDDEPLAFARLKEFASRRALILLSSEASLLQRIRAAKTEFPFAEIIERGAEEKGEPLEVIQPAHHYQASSIRQQWAAIRAALDRWKIASDASATPITSELQQTAMHINAATQTSANLPVLIATSYHPNWRRADGNMIYAATPFYMLTFVKQSTSLSYGRRLPDQLALWISLSAGIALCWFTGSPAALFAWRASRRTTRRDA